MERFREICVLQLLFFALLSAPVLSQEQVSSDMLLGKYETKHYAMFVPLDWVVTPTVDGFGREKFSPKPEAQEFKDLRCDVRVMKFPATLEEYYTAITNEDPDNMKKASLSRDTIGATPAFQLNYTKVIAGQLQQMVRIIAVQNGLVYDLTFSCLPDTYPQYQKLLRAMIKSFEIKPGATQ